jgi:gliding motility-associated-like protein
MIKITNFITKVMCFALLAAFAGGNAYAQCDNISVSSAFPASGPYNTVVDIEGSGFLTGSGTTAVTFNGIAAGGFSVVADNLIKAVVPQNATTGMLTLTTNGCTINAGTFTIINSNCSSSETITAQPFSQSVCEFEDATFTVTVDMPAGFNYQWRVLNNAGNWVNVTDGEHYSGATTTTLTIVDAPLDFVGNQYYCVATLSACTLVSNAVQLTVSPVPVVIINGSDATCILPTGSITITPSVGEGLTYSTDGVNYTASTTISGLSAGNYNLYVKSSAGCISVVPFTVNSQIELPAVAAFTVVQPTCENPSGTITVTGPLDLGLTYSIGGVFQSNPVFSNLAPGTYQITVQTLLGCTSVTADIVINPVPATPVEATVTATQPTCETPTGTIEVTAPLGAQYTYSVDGINYQASTTFSGLAVNNYTVHVKDGGSCPSNTSTQVSISPVPATPVAATATATQPTCDTPTGSITVTAPLGAGYTYSIDNTNWQAATTFTGLATGNYTVYVRFEGSCPAATSTPIAINAVPSVPAVATVTTTQPTCEVPTGSITVTAPVGAGYTYSIDNANWQDAATFTGLAVGSYTIYVSNNGSCPSATTTPATINDLPAVPVVATVSATQPSCGTTTGTITVTSPVGAQYAYSIDNTNWQAGTSFTGLAAGNYTIYVRDNGSCPSQTTTPVTIDELPAVPAVATATATQPTCDTPTGSIEVTSPIGSQYTYSVDGTAYQSATMFAGLAAGNYTVYVKDGSSCPSQTTTPVVINAVPSVPAVAIASAVQPTCAFPTGTIQVSAPMGSQYSYSIDNVNWQSGTIFANLAPGNYTVYVSDSGSCPSATTTPITINAVPNVPAVATLNVTQPNCTTPGAIEVTAPLGGQYTYSLDDTNYQYPAVFTGLTDGNYTVYVRENNGCPSATSTVTLNPVPATPAAASVTVTQPTCQLISGTIQIDGPMGSNYTYSIDGTNWQSSAIFAGLDEGDYMVYVRDGESCASAATPVTIDAIPNMPDTPVALVTQPTCSAGGLIEISSPIGVSYSINGTDWQPSATFHNLVPGTYVVQCMNPQGCISYSEDLVILDNTAVTPIVTSTEGCELTAFGKAYVINAQPADNSFDASTATYVWKNEQGNVIGNNENILNVTEYLADYPQSQFPLNFTLTVTTMGGCTNTFNFVVEGSLCGIPKGISPNNDGMNDKFDLVGMNVSKVSIFNRYGEKVYSKDNYRNEWIGQGDNGGELPSGTYYYVIESAGASQTGWVYVNREEN